LGGEEGVAGRGSGVVFEGLLGMHLGFDGFAEVVDRVNFAAGQFGCHVSEGLTRGSACLARHRRE
jgi:hypothetical protein